MSSSSTCPANRSPAWCSSHGTSERRRPIRLQPVLQQELGKIAGVRVAAFQPPALPGSFGLPVQFVIVTTDPFARLNDVAQQFLQQAVQSGMFIFLDCDLKFDNPQSDVDDRSRQDRTAWPEDERRWRVAFGAARRRLCQLLQHERALLQGDPAGAQRFRLNPQQLLDYYIKTSDGIAGAAVHRRQGRRPGPCRNRSIISSSSTARRYRASPCRASRRAMRLRYSAKPRGAHAARRVFGRLRGLEQAIHPGERAASSRRSASL